MRESRIKFDSGELALEGILIFPDGEGPFPAVVVCHPHPLYGGSMHNNVVSVVCIALAQASIISLKFNFRGVGSSQGAFSQGTGEQGDVAAAISYITSLSQVKPDAIGLAGYSAGAAFGLPVACEDERVKAIAAVSPPLPMFDFEFLRGCLKPKILICGDTDDFTPADRFLGFCQELPEPKECRTVEGADHFWWGHESGLADKVAAFFAKGL